METNMNRTQKMKYGQKKRGCKKSEWPVHTAGVGACKRETRHFITQNTSKAWEIVVIHSPNEGRAENKAFVWKCVLFIVISTDILCP